MKNFVLSFITALTLALGTGAVLAPAAYAASPTDSAKEQVCAGVGGQVGARCGSGANELEDIIAAVLNVISLVAGIAAVIMIVISGFKYITSGGDSQAIASAKKTLVYAIVGLVIVALSQTIVRFVLGKL